VGRQAADPIPLPLDGVTHGGEHGGLATAGDAFQPLHLIPVPEKPLDGRLLRGAQM